MGAGSTKQSTLLFVLFMGTSFACALLLQCSNLLSVAESQTINQRFEWRRWLLWSKTAGERLNFSKLADHQQNQMPTASLQSTLDWLLEENHPPIAQKIAIFNLIPEIDEPDQGRVSKQPWLKPLLNRPLSGGTLATCVESLARGGARAIIIDDALVVSDGAELLAMAIRKAAAGDFNDGKTVPVLLVRHAPLAQSSVGLSSQAGGRSAGDAPSRENAVLARLAEQESGVDVLLKYSPLMEVVLDTDLYTRRIRNHSQKDGGGHAVVQVLKCLGGAPTANVPEIMDIDFIAGPDSTSYPVRPISFLLNPESLLTSRGQPASDVHINDAIVLLGDGAAYLHNTPFSTPTKQMSNMELLAQAIDTVARGSWPLRLDGWQSLLYLLPGCLVGAAGFSAWKTAQDKLNLPGGVRIGADVLVCLVGIGLANLVATLLFCNCRLLVPLAVSELSLMLGFIGVSSWEREQSRKKLITAGIDTANENLRTQMEIHEAQANAQQIIRDRERRRDFIRRINHDLRAPVSAMNWVLAPLLKDQAPNSKTKESLERLAAISDRMTDLIGELSKSFADEFGPMEMEAISQSGDICDLSSVVADCVKLQRTHAEVKTSRIELDPLPSNLLVRAVKLDLSRAIDNIIRNALIHNPDGIKVKVSVESTDFLHTVVISDNGKGIPPEHLSRIFDSYYRGDSEKPGEGLGLSIAKSSVESMGGQVAVYSKVGQGTTFLLSFKSEFGSSAPLEVHDADATIHSAEETNAKSARPKQFISARDTQFRMPAVVRDDTGADRGTESNQGPARYTGLLDIDNRPVDENTIGADGATTVLVGFDPGSIAEVIMAAQPCKVRVVGVSELQGAVDKLARIRFDAIFLSVFSVKDIEAALRLRDAAEGVPVALLLGQGLDPEIYKRTVSFNSTSDQVALTVEAARAGIHVALKSPLSSPDFQQCIDRLLAACPNGRPKILVVDDDETFASSMAALLGKHGYVVRRTSRSTTAMKHIEEFSPDLILLDVMMPELTGLDLCKLIRSSKDVPQVPIIFVTSEADLHNRVKFYTFGADDYVPKPVLVEELLDRIKIRIDRARLIKERSLRDEMTGLLRTRVFSDLFAEVLTQAQRQTTNCCLAIVDVDHLGSINDAFGHASGDIVLIGLSKLLQRRFRVDDLRGRWSGGQLCMGFNASQTIMQQALARVLEEFTQMSFQNENGQPLKAFFSCGVSSYPDDGTTLEELVRVAETRLLTAKQAGGKVVVGAGWHKNL